MERMLGIDAGFLYMETPSMHMHTLKVAILKPPGGTLDFDVFTDWLLTRLDALPPLRRRVQPIPWALHHPLWISDRPVDPRHHFFYHRLRSPGSMHELHELIGRIAGTPLHRDVPLWELHLVEGLEGGRVAVVGKMHHALADGVAANALLGNVTDQGPGGPPARSPQTPTDETPHATDLALIAVRDAVLKVAEIPGLLLRTIQGLLGLARHERAADADVPRPILDTPPTHFNTALTPRRALSTESLPLADLKRVKEAHGGTLNDVVLALVGGALRRYLLARGELPRHTLVAGVPTATDSPGADVRLGGNRVSNLFTVLGTDEADPVVRLRRIGRTTTEAKRVQQTIGVDMLFDWVEFSPPGPLSIVMRLYSRLRLARLHPAPFNVVVSNVPGPREPVTIAGVELADIFSVGPILEGIGLNVTVWSYVDRMNITLLTCPDVLPDLDALTAELRPALAELLATVPGYDPQPRPEEAPR